MMGEIKNEMVKAAPPAGVSALSCAGVALSDWVYIITLVYLFIQIGWLIAKIYWRCCDRSDK